MCDKRLIILLLLGITSKTISEPIISEKEHCLLGPDPDSEIECKVVTVKEWECVESNVISLLGANYNQTRNININLNHTQPLVINCTAPYPIDVRISGFQISDPNRILFIRNTKNILDETTFVYSIGVVDTNFTTPRTIQVFRYTNPSIKITFSLFQPGPGQHIFSPKISSKKTKPHLLKRSDGPQPQLMVIPCVSENPKKIPGLEGPFELQLGNLTRPDVPYDKTRGFLMDPKVVKDLGVYRCFDPLKNENGSEMLFQVFKEQELVVEPNIEQLVLFENDLLDLKCKSKRKIRLVGEFKGHRIVSQTKLSANGLFISTFQHRVKVKDSANIKCVVDEGPKVEVLFEWMAEALDIYNNTKLQLTKVREDGKDEVQCLSQSDDVKLQTLFCQGVSNCDSQVHCFNQESDSPSQNLRIGTSCQRNASGFGSCLSFPDEDPHFSQGMVNCQSGNMSYTTKYLRGFDGVLYFDWEAAPINALIELTALTNMTMYAYLPYFVGCRASKFISDGRIQWVIRDKHGTETILAPTRFEDLPPTKLYDYDLYTVRESNLEWIVPNDYNVLCMVPMWNSTQFVRNYKPVNIAARHGVITGVVISSCVVIVCLLVLLSYVMWKYHRANEKRNLTDAEVEEFRKGNLTLLAQSKDQQAHELINAEPYDNQFEIPRKQIIIDIEKHIAPSRVGLVVEGKVEGHFGICAIKLPKPESEISVTQFQGFLTELKIRIHIAQGNHPFVVGLVGACTEKIKEKKIYIVLEYCAFGSLDRFLKSRSGSFVDQVRGNVINPEIKIGRLYDNMPNFLDSLPNVTVSTCDLLRWSHQVASGMDYLESRKVIHGDLAARNILLHLDGTAKITDFDLSRQLHNYAQYVKKNEEPLPWRWMAIESLKNSTYSSQSDVWGYGVLLWELYSLADLPYPGLNYTVDFVNRLEQGLRLSRPLYATSAIYDIMLTCWLAESERPSFKLLAEYFRNSLASVGVPVQEAITRSDQTVQSIETVNETDRISNNNIIINTMLCQPGATFFNPAYEG